MQFNIVTTSTILSFDSSCDCMWTLNFLKTFSNFITSLKLFRTFLNYKLISSNFTTMDHSGRDPWTPVASCTLAADRDVLYLFSFYLVRHDVRRDDDRFSYVGLGLTHTDDLLSRHSRAVRRRRLVVRHHGRRKRCRLQRRRRHAPVVRADRK